MVPPASTCSQTLGFHGVGESDLCLQKLAWPPLPSGKGGPQRKSWEGGRPLPRAPQLLRCESIPPPLRQVRRWRRHIVAASGPGSFPERGNLKGSSEPEPLIHLFKFAGMLVVWPSQCDPSGMLVVWLSQWAHCFYCEARLLLLRSFGKTCS